MINAHSNDLVRSLDKRRQTQIMALIGQITLHCVIALYFEVIDARKVISIISSYIGCHTKSISPYKVCIVRLVGRKQGIESDVIVTFTLFLLTNRCCLLAAFSSIIHRLMHMHLRRCRNIPVTSYWRQSWILHFMHSNVRD